jgi:hypothetical protein
VSGFPVLVKAATDALTVPKAVAAPVTEIAAVLWANCKSCTFVIRFA